MEREYVTRQQDAVSATLAELRTNRRTLERRYPGKGEHLQALEELLVDYRKSVLDRMERLWVSFHTGRLGGWPDAVFTLEQQLEKLVEEDAVYRNQISSMQQLIDGARIPTA